MICINGYSLSLKKCIVVIVFNLFLFNFIFILVFLILIIIIHLKLLIVIVCITTIIYKYTRSYLPRAQLPTQNNDNNYNLYASAVITCTRAQHAFNFVSNLNNSNKSLLPALLIFHCIYMMTLYNLYERHNIDHNIYSHNNLYLTLVVIFKNRQKKYHHNVVGIKKNA